MNSASPSQTAAVAPVDGVPVVNIDLESVEATADPFPLLEQVRAAGPLVMNIGRPAGYLLTDFKTCQRVMGNHRFYQQSRDFFIDRFGAIVFQAIDNEMHDVLRGIWADEFTRDELAARRTTAVHEMIDRGLDEFVPQLIAGEEVDVAPRLRLIPAAVIAHMMGINEARFDEFVACAHVMSEWREGMADPTPRGREIVRRANEAGTRLNELVDEELRERMAVGIERTDLIGLLLVSAVGLEHMTHREKIATCCHLLFAGNDTTGKLMGLCVAALAQHPDQRRLLAEDPSLVVDAIDELVRYSSPAAVGAFRTVISPEAVVHGHRLEVGQAITPLLLAANRDPERWEDPSRLDFTRERKQHLGFGFGMHSCLGQNLARLEVQILLTRLLARVPDWSLARPVDYGGNAGTRGPVSLVLVAG